MSLLNRSSTHWLKIVIPLIILLPFIVAATFSATTSHTFQYLTTHHQIEAIVNLGVPVGNGSTPKHVALNSRAGQVYILGEGIPVLNQGNGLSGYDIASGKIVEHVKINQGDNEALDLQFDPVSGLLFALWREQFSDTSPTLSVIDSQSLQTIQNIPGIERFATREGRLYTVDTEQLVVHELSGSNLVERQSVDLSPATPSAMAVNPAANRLYLARHDNNVWSIDTFATNGLTPIGSAPIDGPVLDILPLPSTDELLVITAADNFRVLYRLSVDGELADLPYELGPRFGTAGVALSQDGERLYFSNGQPRSTDSITDGPALIGLASSDLSPLHDIPLLTNFDDLVIDDETHQAFAIYPFDNFLYVIDLEEETVKIANTAIEIRDVLLDEASNQIFVSDSANRVRRLDAESFEVLAERQLAGNSDDYGFKSTAWAGELALDRGRNRLYVSGLPAMVLEADSLTEITALEPGGQLAPDPTSDNIYVSNCGIIVLDASTLQGDTLIPDSGPRADGLSPNPCVGYSQLDPANQLLYSLVPNGTPGSNSGNFLYVYDLGLEPSLIFTDTEISIVRVEPDSPNRRAFVNSVREGNRRLRTLNVPRSGSVEYTHHLMGLWGDSRYSPTTNQLYLSDRNHHRLLTLDADTLSVIDELSLPPNYNYRLAELESTNDRLYLVGLDGQLLVVAPNTNQVWSERPPSLSRSPTGEILSLESTDGSDILARIEAEYDNKSDIRLYHSPDEGKTWIDLSQNLPSLAVQALAGSSNNGQDQTLFAGLVTFGQTGGLYKSTNNGQSWTPAMGGLQDLWVDGLFISPDFEQTGLIFAKTTHTGLHQSIDGGQSWTPLAPLSPNAFFPSASQSAAVAFDGQGVVLTSQALETMHGIYRAALQPDGALSEWEQLFDLPIDRLAFSPDGEIVLAYGDGFWRSTDGGETWAAGGVGLTGVDNLKPDRILFSPSFEQDKTVYLYFKGISNDPPSLLFRSIDGGQSWQPWIDPISGGNSFTAVTLTPKEDFIFGDNNTQLTRLSPSDLNWADSETIFGRFPLSDLAASPNYKADQTLFALSSEYGLFKSTNGQDWQLTSFPVRTHRASPRDYHLAISPAYAQDQTLYITTRRSLHRSTNGGQSWEQLQPDANQALSFPAQKIALSPNFARDRTLLVSTATAVYRSTDSGDTWQPVLTPEINASTSDVLSFASDGDTIYARFGYSHSLFTSTDRGQTWQSQPSTIGEYFTIIDTVNTPDNSLLAVMEYDTRLVQAGPQIPPWRDFTESLPAELTNIQAVVYGPNDTLFIGGQGGVFRTSDKGQSWQLFTTGLPPDANIHHLYATDTNLFTALANGRVFTYVDGDDSWIDISVVK